MELAICTSCGLELPAWHVTATDCIDCAADSYERYEALQSLNDFRDDVRAGRA